MTSSDELSCKNIGRRVHNVVAISKIVNDCKNLRQRFLGLCILQVLYLSVLVLQDLSEGGLNSIRCGTSSPPGAWRAPLLAAKQNLFPRSEKKRGFDRTPWSRDRAALQLAWLSCPCRWALENSHWHQGFAERALQACESSRLPQQAASAFIERGMFSPHPPVPCSEFWRPLSEQLRQIESP